jgi:hypothetical protein
VNLLPLLPVHGGSIGFEASLTHAKQAMNELFQHASFPYHEICALHERITGQEGAGPVEVTFNVEPVDDVPRFAGDRPALLASANHQIEFDLMFNLFLLDGEIRIELDYDTGLFAEDTAYGWLNLFSKIVENYAGQADPGRAVRSQPSTRLASISR